MTGPTQFALHPSLQVETSRREFDERGRVQIKPFLSDESARKLALHVEAREDWRLVLNAGDKVFEIDRAAQEQLSDLQRRELEKKVGAAARSGFQYRFESIRISDFERERLKKSTLLDKFALFMSSQAVLAALRAVTGIGNLHFADAQATCYRAGHFLTRHDDKVDGKNREAAYVLGLTKGWNPDWGGLLLFHGENGRLEQALTPDHNVLNLFEVPKAHSVTMVTPFAGSSRYSVTGWLRSARPSVEAANRTD